MCGLKIIGEARMSRKRARGVNLANEEMGKACVILFY